MTSSLKATAAFGTTVIVLVTTGFVATWSRDRARDPGAESAAPPSPQVRAAASQLMQAPLVFEPNGGQTAAASAYLSQARGYELHLHAEGAALRLKGSGETLRLMLRGASADTGPVAESETPATVSYFTGRDRRRWLRGLPTYERVRYPLVYPGIDLLFYGNEQRFEYDFIVAPGADPAMIRIAFHADRVALDPSGDLLLHVGRRTVRQTKPAIYQEIDGARVEVAGGHRIVGDGEVAFEIGAYDDRYTLVIDPFIEPEWGRYVANTNQWFDEIAGVAVTSNGELVVAANEQFKNLTPGDVIVSKLRRDGTLINRTRLLGSGKAAAIAVDDFDNVYVAGTTEAVDFPTTENALLPHHPVLKLLGFIPLPFMGGAQNGFLAKFRPDLHDLLYSTYLGGDGDIGAFGAPFPGASFVLKKALQIRLRWTINPGNSGATALAVMPGTENAYVVGWTESGMFPTTNTALQTGNPGTIFLEDAHAAWVAVLDTTQSGEASMRYGSYYGGSCATTALAIAVDVGGAAIMTGKTYATNDTWWGQILCGHVPYTNNAARLSGNGFLVYLPPPEFAFENGSIYSTYLEGEGVAVGPRGNYGADVIESRFTRVFPSFDGTLHLTRVTYNDTAPLTLDSRNLGWGADFQARAGLFTVLPMGNLYPPIAHLLFRNLDEHVVAVERLDVASGELEEIMRFGVPGETLTARAIAGRGAALFLGLDTTATSLWNVGAVPNAAPNGWVGKFPYDVDPTDNGPDVVVLTTPGDLTVHATGFWTKVTFTVTAEHLLHREPLTPHCSPESGSLFPIGRTEVVCSAESSTGQTATRSFAVDVVDPIALTLPAPVVTEALGPAGAPVSFLVQASNASRGLLPVSCNPSSGSVFPLGTTVVTCTATADGENASGSFTVTVQDTKAPFVSIWQDAPSFVVTGSTQVVFPQNANGGWFTFSADAQDTVDGALPVTCEWNGSSTQTYPATVTAPSETITVVVCSATDARGNSGSASFRVSVSSDVTPPVISGTPFSGQSSGENTGPPRRATEYSLDEGAVLYLSSSQEQCQAFADAYRAAHPSYPAPACLGITAWDAGDNSAVPVFCVAPGMTPDSVMLDDSLHMLRFPPYEPYHAPILTVTCLAADSRGNTASAPFELALHDHRPPVFTSAPSDVYAAPQFGDSTATVFWTEPTAVDGVDGSPRPVTCQPASGSEFEQGDTLVICMTSGVAKQGAQVQFTVHVGEEFAPPPTTVIFSGPDDNPWVSSSATFTFGLIDDDEVPIPTPPDVTFECRLDGAAWTPCESPLTYEEVAPGYHEFEVRARNHYGPGSWTPFGWTSALPPPGLKVPGHMVLEATGAAGAPATFEVLTPQGAPDDTIVCTPASGSMFPIGSTLVACSMGEEAAAGPQGAFTIMVRDTTPPVLALPDHQFVSAADASGATFQFTLEPAIDAVDGSVATTCSSTAGAIYPIGATQVTCSASDSRGNTAHGSFWIIVVDRTPPVIASPGDLLIDATGPAGAIVTFSVSAVDNVDVDVQTACSATSGTLFPLATTSVSCVAFDAAFNVSDPVTFTITVADLTAPTIAAPPGVIAEATGAAGAVLAEHVLGAPAYSDAVGPVAITRSPAGSQFALGETAIVWTATDGAGNTATAQQMVVVRDTTPPVVSVPDGIVLEATSPSGAGAQFDASAIDVVDGSVAPTCIPASGSLFALGVTRVTCSAADAAGNVGVAGFEVAVRDTTPPVVTVPDDIVLEASGPTGAVAHFDSSAFDIVDGAIAASCVPASGSMFGLGVTHVTCAARDAAGNLGSASFPVTVRDATPPVIASLTPSPSLLWPPNRQMIPVTIAAEVSDAADRSPVCRIAAVTSNDRSRDTRDWAITGALTLQLRAELSPAAGAEGRVYAIDIACTDASGNSIVGAAKVRVPRGLRARGRHPQPGSIRRQP